MYRFLLKPGWILSHLFVLTVVVLMINLGFWQLRRLDERKTYNAKVEARETAPEEPIEDVVPAGVDTDPATAEAVAYREVTARGRYRVDEQVLVRNRTQDGAPGYWVITPLVLDDGAAVAVNRGWVSFNTTNPDGPWSDFDPPSGQVTVTGMLQETQEQNSGVVSGPADPAEGQLTALSRVDVRRLDQQAEESFYPLYVNLESQQPAQPGLLPVPVPPPELSEGPHLDYAGQWFIFSALTMIVYPLLLRRVARNKAAEDGGEDTATGDAAPDGPEADDPDGSTSSPADTTVTSVSAPP